MKFASPETGGSLAVPPTRGEDAIVFEGVGKSFWAARRRVEITAIKDVSLIVQRHRFFTLLGPSGCGKSTVLRLVDGLIEPDRGTISVLGGPPKPGPEIGFVFQSFRLIPWATTQANVEFALKPLKLTRAERADRALHYLELVGLAKFRDAYPGELSGGMKQRAALARAYASEPKLLLMDEPFASIDAQTRELMQLELMRAWGEKSWTVLFVTHSVDEAIVLSDEIVLMGPRPGRVTEIVPVDLKRPRWAYDARSNPHYVELRSYLSARMRELVLSDPASEFYGRDILTPTEETP